MRRRPDYPGPVVKTLFAYSNNVCSFIELDTNRACEEKMTDPSWPRVKARISHIRGLAPGSARYDPSYPTPIAFENLLLLCPNHHVVVDDLEPTRYTIDVLLEMKERALSRAEPATHWTDDKALARFADQLRMIMIAEWTAREELQKESTEVMKQILAGAINRLGDREKILLSLYYFEDLPMSQIATVMGVSDRTARRIRSRALLQLQQTIGLVDWDLAALS